MRRITFFAGYNHNNLIEDYVLFYIKELSKISDVYYLADCINPESELNKLLPYVKEKFSYRHGKYDFGSWQELLNKIGYKKLSEYDELILCNDSCFAPLFDFKEMFEKMNKKNNDFWGASLNTYRNIEHLQSYFLVFKKNVFCSAEFKNFFSSIKAEVNKVEVVYNYELKLTPVLAKRFKYAAYLDYRNLNINILPIDTQNYLDPCFYWDQTIKQKFPFLKTILLREFAYSPFIKSVNKLENFIKKNTSYNVDLIKKFKKNSNIKTNNMFLLFKNKIKRALYIINFIFSKKASNNVKYIALYLPQFHTFKENDEWWGKGFTEWTNTRAAIPLFKGHYQPYEPHEDVGYYDLSTTETMIKQAEMAKKYGIYGFCYYFYWFNGRKLMEKPLENMLNDKKVDIPFCFMWANHNWTRSWDAGNKEILLEQTYDKNTNKKFIDDLMPYFKDERYIRIDDKPVLLIYQMDLIPNPKNTVNEWREYAKTKYNIELYIISTQQNNMDDPRDFNCDAAMEGTPNFRSEKSLLTSNTPELASDTKIIFYDYLTNIFIYLLRKKNRYKLFRCVYPMFDNTARRKKKGGWMFLGACPELFRMFLAGMSRLTIKSLKPEEQFVFINAWNEWAEGAHLEPDKKYGYQLLEICREIGSMNMDELKKNDFSKKLYKEMNKKLYPLKFIQKEKIGNIRNIKILNKTVFSYKKRKSNS